MNGSDLYYTDSMAGLQDRRAYAVEEYALQVNKLMGEYLRLKWWQVYEKVVLIIRIFELWNDIGEVFTPDGYTEYVKRIYPTIEKCSDCQGRGFLITREGTKT
jgi:hypothetical protein